MTYEAVIFDYGNTLVSYYSREEWPGILDAALAEVAALLRERGRLHATPGEIARVAANHPIRDLFVENPPIEEIIARLYGEAK